MFIPDDLLSSVIANLDNPEHPASQRRLYLIKGPPGSGKTTLAQLLERRLLNSGMTVFSLTAALDRKGPSLFEQVSKAVGRSIFEGTPFADPVYVIIDETQLAYSYENETFFVRLFKRGEHVRMNVVVIACFLYLRSVPDSPITFRDRLVEAGVAGGWYDEFLQTTSARTQERESSLRTHKDFLIKQVTFDERVSIPYLRVLLSTIIMNPTTVDEFLEKLSRGREVERVIWDEFFEEGGVKVPFSEEDEKVFVRLCVGRTVDKVR